MLVLNKLTALLQRTEGVGEFFFGVTECGPQLVSPTRVYTNLQPLARGDLADVFLAEAEKQRFVLKICRDLACNSLLVTEHRMLRLLVRRSGKTQYQQYTPSPFESFIATGELAGSQVNVFAYRDGFHTLESIRASVPAGLDARHLGWLFKRMLVAIGYAHCCGLVHGAILPPHLLVQPEDHSLQLVDWIGAVQLGQHLAFVPEAYSAWYPREVLHKKPATAATDLFLAAKSLIYAAGGNPVTDHWPDAVPREMRQFVDTCLSPATRRRPQDAWRLHDEFDALLFRLFGPPKYHPLVIE
jgi:hypothetical protein